MAWRALGPDRLNLVTDAVAALGTDGVARRRRRSASTSPTPAGCATPAGVLAGSVLSLDQAVRNLVAFTGCAVPEALAHGDVDPGRPARPDRPRPPRTRRPRRRRPCSTPTCASSPRSSAGRSRGGRDRAGRRARPRRSWPTSSAARCVQRPAPVLGLATGQLAARRRTACSIGRGPRRRAVVRPAPARCCSTSTSACRRITRRRTARSSGRELTDHVDLDPRPPARPRCRSATICRRVRGATRRSSPSSAASTSSCSASGPTGTSGSTSRRRRLTSRTRIKTLTDADPSRQRPLLRRRSTTVPRHVVTQGLATIGAARHAVLVATGADQGGADRGGRRGPADVDVPGLGAAAAPPRDRRRRRGGGGRPAARRLLPRRVRRQAGLAGL